MATKLKEYMVTPTESINITPKITAQSINVIEKASINLDSLYTEVNTQAEMDANKIDANIGKMYKYTGDTTTSGNIYTKNRLYLAENAPMIVCMPYTSADTHVYYSIDGTSWITGPDISCSLRRFCFGDGKFVGVGTAGKSAVSVDGITWTNMEEKDTTVYYGVAYGDDRFVRVSALGDSYYSTDASTWQPMSGLSEFSSRIYSSVSYGNGTFIVTDGGYSAYCTNKLNWNYIAYTSSANFNSSTYGGELFVRVGPSGRTSYSTDGINWNWSFAGSSELKDVAYGNGKFVCVGVSGTSYYSTNCASWTAMSGLDTSISYNGITYGGGKFICVGDSGKSAYSTDGISWTAMSGLNTSVSYYAIASRSSN